MALGHRLLFSTANSFGLLPIAAHSFVRSGSYSLVRVVPSWRIQRMAPRCQYGGNRMDAIRLRICCLATLVGIGCSFEEAGHQLDTTVGREVDIRMDIPPVVVDEMSPATWNWGGLRPDPENEISLADRPRVLQSDVERDRFLLSERHRIRQLEVGGAELWRFDPAEAHPGGRVELDSACRLGGDTLLAFDRNNLKLFALHIGESGFTAA